MMKEILLFIMKDLGKKLLYLLRVILIIAGAILGIILVIKLSEFLDLLAFGGKGGPFPMIVTILLFVLLGFTLGIYIYHIVLAVKYYKEYGVTFDVAWHKVWDDSDE